jgi:hypothetical protein
MSIAVLARGPRARGVMSELPPILWRALTGVAMDTLDALGVVFLTEAFRSTLLFASPSCLAVMPTHLLALDPAVMPRPALAAVLLPNRVFGAWSSPSMRRVTTRGRAGVVAFDLDADGVARPEGVARPDGVARPCKENEAWEEARERCEATDWGRVPVVGGESLAAATNMPQFAGQLK